MIRKYKDFSELTPTIIHEFVDRIEIHERADRRHRVTTQKVDIYLNFIGTYIPPIEEEAEEQDPEEAKAHRIRMERLTYQREYKKRREANGGLPLGHFTGQRPDDRTPEQKAADEAAKKERLKEYHRNWYQDNKERMKSGKAAKRAVLTPDELAAEDEERKRRRREYEREYTRKNRDKVNAYAREWKRNKREQDKKPAI